MARWKINFGSGSPQDLNCVTKRIVEALPKEKVDMVTRGGVYNSSFSTRLLLEPLRFHQLVHSRGLSFPNRSTYSCTSGKQFLF